MNKSLLSLAALALVAATAHAQAPAGAPAGANGICKDGSYSMQATKDGACRGHKGVQSWYSADTGKAPAKTSAKASKAAAPAPAAMPAPTPAAMAPSRPAPAPAPAQPMRPAPAMPAPAAAAPAPMRPAPTPAASAPAASTPAASTPGKRLSPEAAAAQKTAAPGGGPGLVWVNTASNVYHCNGDAFYGKTKAGAYMSEADAKAKGAHGDRGKVCTNK